MFVWVCICVCVSVCMCACYIVCDASLNSVQGYGYTNPELVVVLDHWRQERKNAKYVNSVQIIY